MEILQFAAYAGLCGLVIVQTIGRKRDNRDWQAAQDELIKKASEDERKLKHEFEEELADFNQSWSRQIAATRKAHEAELAEMEASCQERLDRKQREIDSLLKDKHSLRIQAGVERREKERLARLLRQVDPEKLTYTHDRYGVQARFDIKTVGEVVDEVLGERVS